MNFLEALKCVKEGEKITREAWGDPALYGCLERGILRLMMADKQWHDWIICEADIFAHDWITVTN